VNPQHDSAPVKGVSRAGDPFLLGVNYWPRRKAMYWWKDFDAGEVRDEFATLKDVGIRYVRFFLLWEDFQPEPERIDEARLRDLATVADLAADAGLKIEPTLFCGHMSGPNWAPAWLISDEPSEPGARPFVSGGKRVQRKIHNVYTDPEVIAAEERLVRAVAGRLAGHPALRAWSLGNEPDLFCLPPTAAAGTAWTKRVVDLIHEIDPECPVTIGLHTADIERDTGLRADQLARVTDFSVMHGYSIYAPWAKEPLDSDVVPFANQLTAALAGRPVLFEEFGLCTAAPGADSHFETYPVLGRDRAQFFPSEDAGAEYYLRVLDKLHRIGSLGGFGWCFADYVPELYDRPPCDEFIHERTFGIVRPDGSLKPVADVIRAFAARKPTIRPLTSTVDLGMSGDEYYRNPLTNLKRLFANFEIR
jgi:endo-1,4-beta-mannosidase